MSDEKMTSITVYFDAPTMLRLATLSKRTRVPRAVFIRDGIDAILARHAATLSGQPSLPGFPPLPVMPPSEDDR